MSLAEFRAEKPDTAEFSERVLEYVRGATLMYGESIVVMHRSADTAVPITHHRVNTIVFAAHEPEESVISFAYLHAWE